MGSPCAPFASRSDLEARWRPLTPAEATQAATLLDDASWMIREQIPDIDTKISSGVLAVETVRRIVCAMVKRSMASLGGLDGVTQQSQTVGPFTVAQQFTNPLGDLYLTKKEQSSLGLVRTGRAFAIDLLGGA